MVKVRSKRSGAEKSKTAVTKVKTGATKTSAKVERSSTRFPERVRNFGRRIKLKLRATWRRFQAFRGQHLHLHKSFRRSYREDYRRETKTPGLLNHAMLTFKMIFQHWRVFVPFIALLVVFYIIGVGMMSEDFYQQFQTTIDNTSEQFQQGKVGNFARAGLLLISTATSGGLSNGKTEVQTLFGVVILLVTWLVTLYLLRHFKAGEQPKLRDGLYNALGPLISTFMIFIVVFIQAIPLMLVVITYSAAVATDFLSPSTPFYALLFFVFAGVMLALSGYLLSSSLVALIAVTTPGLYPLQALFAASDLMAGRRIKFIIRLLYGVVVLVLTFIIVMMPIILIDLWLKSVFSWLAGWPIVPFCLLVLTNFAIIYATTYLYLYYRWLLDDQHEAKA